MAITYKDAGVDIVAGDALVEWLQKDKSPQPFKENIISGIGGFAALFRAPFKDIKKPVLVSSTDGVGTKVKLAADFRKFEGVGQDLVAMSVNDLICTGGRPLFFLDYYATGKLDLEAAQSFLKGVRYACHASGCALIGGETAEMPGIYHGNDFDAAGFAIGVVDEDEILGAHRVRPGQVAVGVSSSGFHSTGYSLLRRTLQAELEAEKKNGGGTWVDYLLKPTHLYAKLAQKADGLITSVAHITGSGMENIPRVLPTGTRLELIPWSWPEKFRIAPHCLAKKC